MFFRDTISRARQTHHRFRDQEAVRTGTDPEVEVVSRLEALEMAVARMVLADAEDNGEAGESTEDMTDPSVQTNAIQRQERERIRQTLHPNANRLEGGTEDDVPSAAEINRRNGEFWGSQRSSETISAGGSPAKTPAPGSGRESEGASFMPGVAAPDGRLLSRTPKTLESDKTWGTNDNIMRRVAYEEARCQRVNAVVQTIQQKNEAFYRRR
jgi:hypothetical protein